MDRNSRFGKEILCNPRTNKGTAFTEKEREEKGLLGLVPPRIFSKEEQLSKVLNHFRDLKTDLEKYVYLTSIQDSNEDLFYRLVLNNLKEMMPIIYTPTVGEACINYGKIFRRPRGIFISIKEKGKIKQILDNLNQEEVKIIVVTDGERILGLGDLGANGIGIPIGKLSLYTACGGFDPSWCLPVMIDVGTNNETLLNDPLYFGLQQKREKGQEYYDLIEEFFTTVTEYYPDAVIQLEDFGNFNAFHLLNKYRNDYCTFDDDIQGTASVTLAGLYNAVKLSNSSLKEQKILFFGAGEAGIGIGNLIVSALKAEGVPEEEARKQCFFVDSKGLVVKSRTDLVEHKKDFAHDFEYIKDFKEAVEKIRPTAIIGVAGQARTFTQDIVELMSEINENPIIFALSNPTSKSECTAEQAYTWSNGKAIFASGSPFDPVIFGEKRFVSGQCNNVYIFPGVGLGVVLAGIKTIPDEIFYVAARELSNQVAEKDLQKGRVFPSMKVIRDVSANIARAVMEYAYENNLATIEKPENILEHVKSNMYNPM